MRIKKVLLLAVCITIIVVVQNRIQQKEKTEVKQVEVHGQTPLLVKYNVFADKGKMPQNIIELEKTTRELPYPFRFETELAKGLLIASKCGAQNYFIEVKNKRIIITPFKEL